MKLNLLLNIDDFRWTNILNDHSKCLDNLGEVLETLIDEEDTCWHHPDIFTLTYTWGNIYDFIFFHDYPNAKTLTGGWMKHRHFTIFKNLWKFCKQQTEPFCRSLEELNNHPKYSEKLNGYLSCINPNVFFVNSTDARFNLEIYYCLNRVDLIVWENSNCFFLPNIHYSNLYLAQRYGVELDSDLKERKKQIFAAAKEYCDAGYKTDTKNSAKEGNAEEVGSEIAKRNFYTYEEKLTQEEEKLRGGSLRKVFSIEKNTEKLYISIDFEKGNCFEVCNPNGEHLGEFRFDGEENGKQNTTKDKSGKHDIWALQ